MKMAISHETIRNCLLNQNFVKQKYKEENNFLPEFSKMSSIEQPGGPNPSKRIKKSTSVDRGNDSDNFNGGSGNDDELLQLQWNNHSNAFGAALANLRVSETFCDVTLISANGENYSAHRVVISACSSHLETMLKPLPRWQHPVLLMPSNVPNKDLRDILAFMYSGEVRRLVMDRVFKSWVLEVALRSNGFNLRSNKDLDKAKVILVSPCCYTEAELILISL